jgi:pilus assembly protein CpaD
MTRSLAIILLAGALAGCASMHRHETAKNDGPRLPSTRFAVALTHTPDDIRLAPHATGLSTAQSSAVIALAQRWRDGGDGPVIIQTPAGGGADAFTGATAVQDALLRQGLTEDQIRIVNYQVDASAAGMQPIVVGFTRYEAHGPACGRDWKDYTKTINNDTTPNFGCAVTANFAAMIANPADLKGDRPMDPSDANRRETIVGHYRKGEQMSSFKDPQANGAVSSVLQ